MFDLHFKALRGWSLAHGETSVKPQLNSHIVSHLTLQIWHCWEEMCLFCCALQSLSPSTPLTGILSPRSNVWRVTTKPSWMSKHRSDDTTRGNGRKNCSFCSPWHAISILHPHLCNGYLKHISSIFVSLRGSPPDMTPWQWSWKEFSSSSRVRLIFPLIKEERIHFKHLLPLAKENTVYRGDWSFLRRPFHQKELNMDTSLLPASF